MITSAKPARAAAPHGMYYAIALVLLVTVFTGFARTYYLKGLFGAPSLPVLVHIHGVVMTIWFGLFAVQVSLVARRKVSLHRRLGSAGIVLAGIVVLLATAVSFGLAKRTLVANPNAKEAYLLLGLQIFSILLVFIILVSLGYAWRKRPEYHKRVMTLAMLSVLGPAITRLPLGFLPNHNIGITIAIDIGFIVAWVLLDAIRSRKLHPVSGWGAALVIGSIFVVAPFAQSTTWIRFTNWLLKL